MLDPLLITIPISVEPAPGNPRPPHQYTISVPRGFQPEVYFVHRRKPDATHYRSVCFALVGGLPSDRQKLYIKPKAPNTQLFVPRVQNARDEWLILDNANTTTRPMTPIRGPEIGIPLGWYYALELREPDDTLLAKHPPLGPNGEDGALLGYLDPVIIIKDDDGGGRRVPRGHE